jgi:transcriptional regulator of acetoin/glycerol metabolism
MSSVSTTFTVEYQESAAMTSSVYPPGETMMRDAAAHAESFFMDTIVRSRGGLRSIPSEVDPRQGEISNPTLQDKIRQEIVAACRRANWRLGGPRGAAARLGMKRTTLFCKMKRLGITPPVSHWQD